MPIKGEMEHRADLVHQARHFRTVLDGFSRNVALLYSNQPVQPVIDSVALATAFSKWREVFDATRPYAEVNRPDFVVFSAGLLMKEMLLAKALVISPETQLAVGETGLAQWPEGYAYASFCLSMAEAVLESMGQEGVVNDAVASKPDFWNSFRENAAFSIRTRRWVRNLKTCRLHHYARSGRPTFIGGTVTHHPVHCHDAGTAS